MAGRAKGTGTPLSRGRQDALHEVAQQVEHSECTVLRSGSNPGSCSAPCVPRDTYSLVEPLGEAQLFGPS